MGASARTSFPPVAFSSGGHFITDDDQENTQHPAGHLRLRRLAVGLRGPRPDHGWRSRHAARVEHDRQHLPRQQGLHDPSISTASELTWARSAKLGPSMFYAEDRPLVVLPPFRQLPQGREDAQAHRPQCGHCRGTSFGGPVPLGEYLLSHQAADRVRSEKPRRSPTAPRPTSC